jgi:RhoGEF domain
VTKPMLEIQQVKIVHIQTKIFLIRYSVKLSKILRELVETEENYVCTLQKGIENYIKSLEESDSTLQLRDPKCFVFGNIEHNIYELHANQFCPALKACGEDVIKIAKTFNHFTSNDYFYCYVLFMLNKPRSQKICGENAEFFQVNTKTES